jgi:hypothetical protein
VFAPEGKYLQTLQVGQPYWVGVHRKSGALYVMNQEMVQGKTTRRLTKYSAFPEMKEVFHADGIGGAIAALDSWSERPRLWMAGGGVAKGATRDVTVWEERGQGFEKILDFDDEAAKQNGSNDMNWRYGSLGIRVYCDPVRERVHVGHKAPFCFDLPSGRLLEYVNWGGRIDDFGFDKKGYMHGHFCPCFYMNGIGRYNPGQAVRLSPSINDPLSRRKDLAYVSYPEVPYDYGVEGDGFRYIRGDGMSAIPVKSGLSGILPVKDQPGSRWFQDGVGVNMRGDVAENCNIYYAPKMEDAAREFIESNRSNDYGAGMGIGHFRPDYGIFMRMVAEMEKRGEDVYYIRRAPGVSLTGATIWTYNHTGELRDECAVIAGGLMNGIQIDEDGKLYFTLGRERLLDGKVFLAGRAGILGGVSGKTMFLGTYVKSAKKDVRVLTERAPIPLDRKLDRPPEVGDGVGLMNADGTTTGEVSWVEKAEWLYAGSSPIVAMHHCCCPTMRAGFDWYRRSWVPECYRQSIGVLDASGNLILHMGRYGNMDSGEGPRSRIPVGGDNIGMSFVRFVSTTDNYAVFDDNSERIVVVRLNYNAEETAGIGGK